MKFETYLNKCLQNPEFKKYWDELNSKPINSTEDALRLLSEDNDTTDREFIIKDKGIKRRNTNDSEIEFYTKASGDCPMSDFLSQMVDQKLKAKTLKLIDDLPQKDSYVRKKPFSSYIDDGIFELRAQASGNIDRIFYFFIFGNKIVMTNGYIKKNQKLDKIAFEKAKSYYSDYMKRNM